MSRRSRRSKRKSCISKKTHRRRLISRKRRSKRYGNTDEVPLPFTVSKNRFVVDDKKEKRKQRNDVPRKELTEKKEIEEKATKAAEVELMNKETEKQKRREEIKRTITNEDTIITFKPINIQSKHWLISLIGNVNTNIDKLIHTHYNRFQDKYITLEHETFMSTFHLEIMEAVAIIIYNDKQCQYDVDIKKLKNHIANINTDKSIINVLREVYNFLFIEKVNYVLKLYGFSLIVEMVNGDLKYIPNVGTPVISQILHNKQESLKKLNRNMLNTLENFTFLKDETKRKNAFENLIYLKFALEGMLIPLNMINKIPFSKPLESIFPNPLILLEVVS